MGKDQKGFIVYGDIKAVIDELSDEQVAQLFRGMVNYFDSGKVPKFSGILKFVWIPIKQHMDRDAEKYEKKCERNRENVRKRWEREKGTKEYDGIRTNTNDTNININKDKNINKGKDKDIKPPESGDSSPDEFIFLKDIV